MSEASTVAGTVQLETCTVDLDRRQVHTEAGILRLTPKECDLLAYLVARPRETVSRDDLFRDVWGYAAGVQSRTPDTTIRTLRKKIEADSRHPRHIVTVHGAGYKLAV